MFDTTEPPETCKTCGVSLTMERYKYCSNACRYHRHWTPERTETFRVLVGEGHEYSAIGKRMGITRNAVIGKARRLGISNGRICTRDMPRKNRKRPARRQGRRQVQRHPSDAINARLRKLPPAPSVTPPEGTKTLMELGPYGKECRYIYGSGPFLYCGQPTAIEGTAWCPYHKAIVFPPRVAVPLKGFIAWRR